MNLARVKHIVERSENPHPLTVVFIIIGSILVLYSFYIASIKKEMSGDWSSDENDIYSIKHNKWNDKITIRSMTGVNDGVVKGNVVVIYVGKTMKLGVWVDDNINWIDGSRWHCVYGF
jgi:hypothetical protein